jgi:hypothetical protein
MFGMFFGLRPERLPDPPETDRRPPSARRRQLAAQVQYRATLVRS